MTKPSSSDAFPSIYQAALLLLATFLLQYAVDMALYDQREALGLDMHQRWALGLVVADGLVLATVLHLQGRSYRNFLHASPSSPWATLFLVVPAVLLLVPLILHLNFWSSAILECVFPLSRWEAQAFDHMAADDLATLIATGMLAPVLEEMLFRGVLLRGFLERYPRWPAIATSALFFGVMHLNIYQFVLAFWLGLLLGWLYERTRSLMPSIALHAAVNLSVLAIGWSTGSTGSGDPALSLVSWALATLMAVLGMAWLRRVLSVKR
ncbi:MAG: CPBP family intramembrane metalloprotease [Hydrogenophaga sp.]|uniref:CPBP family intramembrane glutamic endopeptidase n=1 Tax=Hydrogenophaga sp. TaxID=1904254 RepID=UPI001D442433|nr:CPBP family intramembrane glutamic endopeptidase [Hydrogenophaga sp.]MBX3610839.1 CPBP family intramembrane metalloprotease [Hydrogenophaga sp.]